MTDFNSMSLAVSRVPSDNDVSIDSSGRSSPRPPPVWKAKAPPPGIVLVKPCPPPPPYQAELSQTTPRRGVRSRPVDRTSAQSFNIADNQSPASNLRIPEELSEAASEALNAATPHSSHDVHERNSPDEIVALVHLFCESLIRVTPKQITVRRGTVCRDMIRALWNVFSIPDSQQDVWVWHLLKGDELLNNDDPVTHSSEIVTLRDHLHLISATSSSFVHPNLIPLVIQLDNNVNSLKINIALTGYIDDIIKVALAHFAFDIPRDKRYSWLWTLCNDGRLLNSHDIVQDAVAKHDWNRVIIAQTALLDTQLCPPQVSMYAPLELAAFEGFALSFLEEGTACISTTSLAPKFMLFRDGTIRPEELDEVALTIRHGKRHRLNGRTLYLDTINVEDPRQLWARHLDGTLRLVFQPRFALSIDLYNAKQGGKVHMWEASTAIDHQRWRLARQRSPAPGPPIDLPLGPVIDSVLIPGRNPV